MPAGASSRDGAQAPHRPSRGDTPDLENGFRREIPTSAAVGARLAGRREPTVPSAVGRFAPTRWIPCDMPSDQPSRPPRLATRADIAALQALIERSARGLSAGYYTPDQIDALVRHVFGVDTQLVADGSYYMIDGPDGPIAAGGWSARRTLYGGDQAKSADDPRLDPAVDAARIRAFFVDPGWARRGLGRALYDACAGAAARAGFHAFELMSTMPGEPLYTALGFAVVERVSVTLPGGVDVELAKMRREIP